jgi:hypothetical protein
VSTAALAPDPVMSRRDELLDDDALVSRLSSLLGVQVDRCERIRTTYHPGRSLRVLLRVESADATRHVSARMFAPCTSTSRFERARVAAGGAALHDEELATVFTIFPFDRKLHALPRLLDGSWPPLPGAGRPRFRLVAHAPERAATAAAVDGDGRALAFVKLYAEATVARTACVHWALRSRGLRVPALLAAWPELRAVAVEPVRGRPPADGRGWRAFGAALARLHRLAPLDRRRFTRFDPDALGAAATTIGALRPDVATAAFALERSLRRAPPARGARLVCLHGDVHPKNAVVDGADAWLVDLDDVAAGNAAADLGSALAGLRYAALVGGGEADGGALLDGYRRWAPLPEAHALRWHTAAALLGERALRAITRLRPDGLARLDAVLTAGLDELG